MSSLCSFIFAAKLAYFLLLDFKKINLFVNIEAVFENCKNAISLHPTYTVPVCVGCIEAVLPAALIQSEELTHKHSQTACQAGRHVPRADHMPACQAGRQACAQSRPHAKHVIRASVSTCVQYVYCTLFSFFSV